MHSAKSFFLRDYWVFQIMETLHTSWQLAQTIGNPENLVG